jgi:hypothetical protein
MSAVPLAIGPTGKRNLNSRMIDRFRSDSPDLPKPYLPIVDLLTTFFPAINPTPLSAISPADRNRILEALRIRVKNYDESVRTRLNTGQLTLRTNSFSSNRSLHLKELIGELLGVGIDGANEWLRTGKAVAPAIPLPPLVLDDQVRDMFRALSYAVAGPSGERTWDTFQAEPPPSPFLDPATNAGLSPLERLRYVYWGLVLRKDLPPVEGAGGAGVGAGAGAGAGAGSIPSATRVHTLPEVLALGERLGAALRPVFEAVRAKYTDENRYFTTLNPYVTRAEVDPRDPIVLIDSLHHFADDPNLDDVLMFVTPGTEDWHTRLRVFPETTAKREMGKEAASLLVSLLLQKMLTPKVDVGTATK